jgi:hypothetical protein
MKKQKRTTGETISRLGMLTCLAQNVLVENHVEDEADRDAMLKEIAETVDGQRGVGTSKIVQRSLERCAAGRFN